MELSDRTTPLLDASSSSVEPSTFRRKCRSFVCKAGGGADHVVCADDMFLVPIWAIFFGRKSLPPVGSGLASIKWWIWLCVLLTFAFRIYWDVRLLQIYEIRKRWSALVSNQLGAVTVLIVLLWLRRYCSNRCHPWFADVQQLHRAPDPVTLEPQFSLWFPLAVLMHVLLSGGPAAIDDITATDRQSLPVWLRVTHQFTVNFEGLVFNAALLLHGVHCLVLVQTVEILIDNVKEAHIDVDSFHRISIAFQAYCRLLSSHNTNCGFIIGFPLIRITFAACHRMASIASIADQRNTNSWLGNVALVLVDLGLAIPLMLTPCAMVNAQNSRLYCAVNEHSPPIDAGKACREAHCQLIQRMTLVQRGTRCEVLSVPVTFSLAAQMYYVVAAFVLFVVRYSTDDSGT